MGGGLSAEASSWGLSSVGVGGLRAALRTCRYLPAVSGRCGGGGTSAPPLLSGRIARRWSEQTGF